MARDKWIRDAGSGIRDLKRASRISHLVSRISYLVSRISILASRIPHPESRLSRTSCLSRSPSTNSDQDQLTDDQWISYICLTGLIHNMHRILGFSALLLALP